MQAMQPPAPLDTTPTAISVQDLVGAGLPVPYAQAIWCFIAKLDGPIETWRKDDLIGMLVKASDDFASQTGIRFL